jgi:hypothetical protein
VVREFGDNNAAGTPSRKHSKNQQGYLSDSRLAETVGHGIKALGSVNRESVRAQCVTKATSGHASWLHCMSLRFGETGKHFGRSEVFLSLPRQFATKAIAAANSFISATLIARAGPGDLAREDGTCPLRQLRATFPYLPPEQPAAFRPRQSVSCVTN